MIYGHIIWDFNGTLLDDIMAGIEAVNDMLSRRGIATIESVAQYRELFCFPIINYYAKLGFDFEKEDYYKVLAPEWVALYLENYKRSSLTDGAEQVLSALEALGYEQTLLSATELEMLTRQITDLGILDRFDGILGMDTIHAHSKEAIAVAWRKAHPDANALMLGDTDHDATVAKTMGADCILLTTGHQSRAVLEKCQCIAVVDSAEEALNLILS